MKNKIINLGEKVIFTYLFVIMISQNVKAYIDPSVMTYAIQAGAGIIIALGAALGIYFRKFKKKVTVWFIARNSQFCHAFRFQLW